MAKLIHIVSQMSKDRRTDKRNWMALAFGVRSDLKLCVINVGKTEEFEHPWSCNTHGSGKCRLGYILSSKHIRRVFCNVIFEFLVFMSFWIFWGQVMARQCSLSFNKSVAFGISLPEVMLWKMCPKGSEAGRQISSLCSYSRQGTNLLLAFGLDGLWRFLLT